MPLFAIPQQKLMGNCYTKAWEFDVDFRRKLFKVDLDGGGLSGGAAAGTCGGPSGGAAAGTCGGPSGGATAEPSGLSRDDEVAAGVKVVEQLAMEQRVAEEGGKEAGINRKVEETSDPVLAERFPKRLRENDEADSPGKRSG